MTPDNDQPPQASALADNKAVRFAMACFLAVQCFPLVRYSLAIPSFGNIFRDMLGDGAELPFVTRILLSTYPLPIIVSVALPIAGVLLLVRSKNDKAFYALGILVLVATLLSEVLLNGLFAPLIKIIEGMSAPR
jgi:hypothetical protein